MKLKIKYLDNYNKDWGLIQSVKGNSGYDLRAAIMENVIIQPNEYKVIPNGIQVELDCLEIYCVNNVGKKIKKEYYDMTFDDENIQKKHEKLLKDFGEIKEYIYQNDVNPNLVEIQIRPRTILGLKKGITILNSPTTIDYNNHGELMTILYNSSDKSYEVKPGDRISQMVVCPIYKPNIIEINE